MEMPELDIWALFAMFALLLILLAAFFQYTIHFLPRRLDQCLAAQFVRFEILKCLHQSNFEFDGTNIYYLN